MTWTKIAYRDPNWKVIKKQERGYYPFYNLYRRKTFLIFSWWSFEGWSTSLEDVLAYKDRWEDWPPKE